MNASTSPNCAGTANNAYYWPAVPPKLTDSQFEQRERHLAKQYRHLDRLRRRHELRMHYLTLRITLGKMNAVLDYWPSTIARHRHGIRRRRSAAQHRDQQAQQVTPLANRRSTRHERTHLA
jgi:hypothetical protein